MKLSKKQKAEILQQRFPEFYRLSKELKIACDAIISELEDNIEKVEEIQQKQEELEELKTELNI